jgi:hypothetical protein
MTNNDMKKEVLGNMTGLLEKLRQQMKIVDALDNDSTAVGFFDLHDQLHTMSKTMDAFDEVVARAVDVVPSHGDFEPMRKDSVDDLFAYGVTRGGTSEVERSTTHPVRLSDGLSGAYAHAAEALGAKPDDGKAGFEDLDPDLK